MNNAPSLRSIRALALAAACLAAGACLSAPAAAEPRARRVEARSGGAACVDGTTAPCFHRDVLPDGSARAAARSRPALRGAQSLWAPPPRHDPASIAASESRIERALREHRFLTRGPDDVPSAHGYMAPSPFQEQTGRVLAAVAERLTGATGVLVKGPDEIDIHDNLAIADLDTLQRACKRGTTKDVDTSAHVDLETMVRVPDVFAGLSLETTGAALQGLLGDVEVGLGMSVRVEPVIWPPGVLVKVQLP